MLLLVAGFLVIKIINYSQRNFKLKNLGYYDRFSKEWVEQVQKCSRTTIQSRNENTAIIKINDQLSWKGDAFYVQTSHTDVFFGLVIDWIYSIGPRPIQLK